MVNRSAPCDGGPLDAAALSRVTGADHVRVLRTRSRPGRTVLHVALCDAMGRETDQGAVWIFDGGKGRRVVRRHPASVLDRETGAVFDRFPADHRLPEIAMFISWVSRYAPGPLRAADAPVAVRYRPGLSCTLEIVQANGERVFTKIIAKEDLTRIAQRTRRAASSCAGPGLAIARPLRVQPEFRAITYEAAPGRCLSKSLETGDVDQALSDVGRVVTALARLSEGPVDGLERLSADILLQRAALTCDLLAGQGRDAEGWARSLLAQVGALPAAPLVRLMHGDMKLDHAFLDGDGVTFIDTETVAAGDPRYDLACLEASLLMEAAQGKVQRSVSDPCRRLIREAAGPGYDWFLAIARLKAARYFAQRPGAATRAALDHVMVA